MFITKKKHHAEILGYQQQLSEARTAHQKDNERHAVELREARDLKTVLETIGTKWGTLLTMTGLGSNITISNVGGTVTWNLPESVAQFVPDHFGGQVIKQEATKVIEISPAGQITTGLTRRLPDEGYDYVLVRHEKEAK